MTRRLLVLALFAAIAQLGSGCCHVRQRIAYRWHYFQDHHPCIGCALPYRAPVAIPAYSSPVVSGSVISGPMFSGPAPGCSSCSHAPEVGPVAMGGPPPGYSFPVTGMPGSGMTFPAGAFPGQPQISGPMPLLTAPTMIEPGVPGQMPGAPAPPKGP